MKKKKIMVVIGGLAAALIFALPVLASTVNVACSVEGLNPIYNQDGLPNKLLTGCLVQVISSETSVAGTPDANGLPLGGIVTLTGQIGSTPETSFEDGEFVFTIPNIPSGKYVYIRAWNDASIGAASYYGTSTPEVVLGFGMMYTPGSFATNVPSPSMTPNITSIVPAVAFLDTVVTVEGARFGTGGSGDYINISGIQVPYASCLSWSATKIEVTVSASMMAGTDVPVFVHAQGQTGNTVNTLDIDPRITSTSPVPLNDLVTGVSSVILYGGGFGSTSASVIFNSSAASGTAKTISVETLVPAGAVDGYVSVEVNGRFSNRITFTMAVASMTTISPTMGAVGDSVTITGESFGIVEAGARSTSANHVYFNGANVPDGNISSWTNASITFNVPSVDDAGIVDDITVEAGGNDAAGGPFTFLVMPKITGVTDPYYISPEVGSLRIYGSSFRGSQGDSVATEEGVPIDILSWSASLITGSLPAFISVGYRTVEVTVNPEGYRSNKVTFKCNPYISALSVSSGNPGDSVKLYGYAFGTEEGSSSVKFGSSFAIVSMWSDTSIEVTIPSVDSGPYSITVDVVKDSQTYTSNGKDFTVGAYTPTGLPIISMVKFGDRTYVPGQIISSRPVITAVVTNSVSTTFKYVAIDPGTNREVRISAPDISYSVSPGLPEGGWLLTAYVRTAISAEPVNAHTVRITCAGTLGAQASWDGNVVVMRGEVQVVGRVYNYPNPFQPLSGDPSRNATRIAYNLNVDAPIMIIIYDITGHEVHRASFRKGEDGGRAGLNSVEWNGKSIFGDVAGNGMYIYKIISSNKVIGSGKLVVFDK